MPPSWGWQLQQLIMLDIVPATTWLLLTDVLHVELHLTNQAQLRDVISS
jgi:hypothetical protein